MEREFEPVAEMGTGGQGYGIEQESVRVSNDEKHGVEHEEDLAVADGGEGVHNFGQRGRLNGL